MDPKDDSMLRRAIRPGSPSPVPIANPWQPDPPMMSTSIRVRVERELSTLVPRFLANCRRDADVLAKAIAQSDLDTTRKIGHSLRGVGGGYGFAEITRLGAVIEAAAKAGDTKAALNAVNAFQAYLKAVQVEYV